MSKKILFLLGSADMSGGTYVILQHATHLQSIGYEVTIALVFMTYQNYLALKASPTCWHPAIKTLSFIHISECHKHSFDIAIFTWWATLFSIEKISAQHYLYFVQSIESRFYPAEETFLRNLVERTYQLGLPVITEAVWIQQYLSKHFQAQSHLVRNGIAKSLYQIEGTTLAAKSQDQLRILVEGPLDAPYKNVARTIALCKEAKVGEVWLLTSSDTTYYPGVARVFSKVPINEVAAIYRSCDVLVKLSYVEGMFGPPLEIFHCGGTAIVYDVTGFDEYIQHEVNALVAKTGDEASVIHYLRLLQKDRNLLAKLISGAQKTAAQWPDWPEASAAFAQALAAIPAQLSLNQRKAVLAKANTLLLHEPISVLISFPQQQKQITCTATPLYNSGHYALNIPLTPPDSRLGIMFGKAYQRVVIKQVRVYAEDHSEVSGSLQIQPYQMTHAGDHNYQCHSDTASLLVQTDARTTQPIPLYLQVEFAPVAIRG